MRPLFGSHRCPFWVVCDVCSLLGSRILVLSSDGGASRNGFERGDEERRAEECGIQWRVSLFSLFARESLDSKVRVPTLGLAELRVL